MGNSCTWFEFNDYKGLHFGATIRIKLPQPPVFLTFHRLAKPKCHLSPFENLIPVRETKMGFSPKRTSGRTFSRGVAPWIVREATFPRAVPALYHVLLSRSGHLSLITNQSSGFSRGDCHKRQRERYTGIGLTVGEMVRAISVIVSLQHGRGHEDTDTPPRSGLFPNDAMCRGVNYTRLSAKLTRPRPIKCAELNVSRLSVN